MTIFDQFTRPVKDPEKRPARRPLAAAPLHLSQRDYVADGLTPARLASVLKEADAGNIRSQAELFEQMEERDGHIRGEMSKRRHVILGADFTISPASEHPRDIRVAEEINRMFQNFPDWEDVLVSMQDAVGKGFSAFELHWDVSEGQAVIRGFDHLDHRRFLFTDKSHIAGRVPLLVTDDHPQGIDIPAWKVMMHRYGGKAGHPVRSGIYRICAWWYVFKHYAIKDWMIFSEVYGMPLRLGKYDPGASQSDKDALERAIRSLGHDAAGIISKSTEIEFISANRQAEAGELYKNLAMFANKEMSKAILGGTLTADVDGKGSYAAANTHNGVRLDLVNADARAMAVTIRDQIIRPYVGFNYGWDTRTPGYSGRLKKEDRASYSDIVEKFADRMDIPVSFIRHRFGIPAPEKGEEVLRSKSPQIFASIPKAPGYMTGSPDPVRDRPKPHVSNGFGKPRQSRRQ